MPQPPTILPKLHVSSRPSELLSAPTALVAFPNFGPSQHTADSNPHQPMFRTKRKHVLKACDRCRVKKTKCDGNQPCYRCASYNHPCLFRERKVTQTKKYSQGFVEMLESHHALVVKALQQLYTHCINNKCFPGEPIDSVDGYPLTHAILDRLGLIKEAEEGTSDILDEGAIEASQYWRSNRRTSSSVDAEDSSSAQASPIERSPVSDSTSGSPTTEAGGSGRQQSFTSLQDVYSQYGQYHCAAGHVWPMTANPTPPQVINFNHPIPTAGFQIGNQYANNQSNEPANVICQENISYNSNARKPSMVVPVSCPPPAYQGPYPETPSFSYQQPDRTLTETNQQYTWAPNSWNRLKPGQHPSMGPP